MSLAVADSSPDRTVREIVTVIVAGQLFGLPIERVRQVFRMGHVTPVPLAPPSVAGLINLRGRVATAIDLRSRLGLKPVDARGMAAGLECQGDAYALVVDEIGDVLRPRDDELEAGDAHLPAAWRGFIEGVYRLPDSIMVLLDVDAVLDLSRQACRPFPTQAAA